MKRFLGVSTGPLDIDGKSKQVPLAFDESTSGRLASVDESDSTRESFPLKL